MTEPMMPVAGVVVTLDTIYAQVQATYQAVLQLQALATAQGSDLAEVKAEMSSLKDRVGRLESGSGGAGGAGGWSVPAVGGAGATAGAGAAALVTWILSLIGHG